MPIDIINLTEFQLGQVDPMFVSTRPGYSKRAKLVFTNGKSEAMWHDTTNGAYGATFPSFVHVDETTHSCDGTCLVDMFAIGLGSFSPAWTSRGQTIPKQLSPGYFRSNLVLSIVHELMHVCQGWQLGKSYGRDFFEEKISAANRAADYSAANPDMPNSGYLQNIFELGARDFAGRWMALHSDEVHKGKFDFLLPMVTLRGIFQDAPNAFKQ